MEEATGTVVRLTPDEEKLRVAKLRETERTRRQHLRDAAQRRITEAQRELAELDKQDGRFTLVRGVTALQHLAAQARDLVERWGKRFSYRYLRQTGVAAAFVFGGVFSVTNVGADGQVKWEEKLVLNGVTTQGMNHVLDVAVHAATQKTTWYIGLINNSPTPTLAVGDTYASHAGWTELTAFSQTLRVTWGVGAASSGSSTNATTSDFSMNATNTVYGLALFSVSTKGDTATSGGVLLSTAAFSGGNQGVSNGDTLKVTYTLTGTPT